MKYAFLYSVFLSVKMYITLYMFNFTSNLLKKMKRQPNIIFDFKIMISNKICIQNTHV